MKSYLLSFGFLLFMNFKAYADIKLYMIANSTNAGDVNQVEGIKTAMDALSSERISSQFFDPKNSQDIAKKVEADLSNNQKVIVIGAGEGGIEGIQNLAPHPHLLICLTSHMLLEKYKEPALLEKVNFIALPAHVCLKDKKIIGPKLIETIGVSHNRKATNMEKTYREWVAELPACSFYLGVILGGDAPMPPPSKGLKWFTKNDATKLASYVSSLAKEKQACVIVLNGPRTGKYDEYQREDLTVHRKGHSDPITEFFVQKLKEQELQVTLFDFQHKTPENKRWVSPYNSFDLVVGALREKEGLLLVPGESTSMISEAVDTLPPGKVVVYQNEAMNNVHETHVKSEFMAGRIAVLENYNQLNSPYFSPTNPTPSAAQTIAQTLLRAINRKEK